MCTATEYVVDKLSQAERLSAEERAARHLAAQALIQREPVHIDEYGYFNNQPAQPYADLAGTEFDVVRHAVLSNNPIVTYDILFVASQLILKRVGYKEHSELAGQIVAVLEIQCDLRKQLARLSARITDFCDVRAIVLHGAPDLGRRFKQLVDHYERDTSSANCHAGKDDGWSG